MRHIEIIKEKIYKLSALTDRGQRLNKLVSNIYQDKLIKIDKLVKELSQIDFEISKERLSGEWELIFSNVELFRSSPFFLSIENALQDKKKSELFFKLHQLQVCSFGLSTIGSIGQTIDFSKDEFISTFDTIIFGITTIPIFGWFKLLPTFGGSVITLASDLSLNGSYLKMKLQKTKVSEVNGLKKIPLFSNFLMDRWYPINKIWKKLPWNKVEPSCKLKILYIDENLRVMEDIYGSIFIYIKKNTN